MGVWSASRKNRCIAQGLVPGVAIHLEAVVKGATLQQTTRVESIDDDGLRLLAAMEGLRPRPLGAGVDVAARYIHEGRRWNFTSEVTGESSDGLCDVLALPGDATAAEERRFFRLPIALPFEYAHRVLPATGHLDEEFGEDFEATVTDLSEGGLRLSTHTPINVNDNFEIEVTLPGVGGIQARLTVLRVKEPSKGRANYHAGCAFTRISTSYKQRIARFLMARQLEMRREGKL